MFSNLKLYTSYVSPENLNNLIRVKNLIPVIIIRNIKNSKLLKKFQNTAVHFKQFSPSNEIYKEWKSNLITFEEYLKKYAMEINSLDLGKELEKIDLLTNCITSSGAVFLGFNEKDKECHRSVLRSILNNSGLLKFNVEEI